MGQAVPLPSPRVGVMGRISGESSEGGVLVLTVELEGTGIIQCVGDMVAHPSSGLLQGPPGSGCHAAILYCHSVGCHQCHLAVSVVGCCWRHSGWLVVVVKGLVMPCHAVCMCNNIM